MKYVVVGGVAGGATAATRIRRNDESAHIVILEKGNYISYANCGLPYYIGGIIEERENLLAHNPESFRKRYNIEVKIRHEVIGIDSDHKAVLVREDNGNEYREKYDKLLLAPGASPIVPPIEGINSQGVFTLRNINNTDRIKHYIQTHNVKRAIVVGAGFIGIEMVDNLYHLGIEAIVIEKSNQVKHVLDRSMASILHAHMQEKGVQLYLENEIIKVERNNNVLEISLKNGMHFTVDMVILAIGVRPETRLARETGIKIGATGGIWVDEYLQSSIPDIYAVGDAIEYPNPVSGKPWVNAMANPANRQGTVAADNMVFGNHTSYEGSIGTVVAKVFDMAAGATGLNAKRLNILKMSFRSAYIHSVSHAGYYPGATPLSIKLTFEPDTGKIYGVQCVGYEGVDKRIDQAAVFIKNGATIYDMLKLEQAYAPPFSSAKDPLAVSAYVARNIISGKMPVVYWEDVYEADRNKVTILDMRSPEEYASGYIPGAINIPVDEIRSRMNEVPRNKPVYTYCHSGMRGYLSQQILLQNGFKEVYNLSGGYTTYMYATADEKERNIINPEMPESRNVKTGR